MSDLFAWPPVAGRVPVWTGCGFLVGEDTVPVLD